MSAPTPWLPRWLAVRWQRLAAPGLRGRVVAMALVPGFVLAALLGVIFVQQRSTDLERRLAERGQLLSRQLANAADYPVFSGNQRVLQSLVEATASESNVLGARVLDAEARPLAEAGSSASGRIGDPGWDTGSVAAQFRAMPERHLMAFAHPIRSPAALDEDWLEADRSTRSAGALTAYAIVEIDTSEVARELRRFAWLVLAVIAIVLPAAWWVALRLARRLVVPINTLAGAVQRVGRGEPGVRVNEGSGIEVMDRLASGFNEMALQLDRSRSELEERVRHATQALQARKDAAERADQAKTRFLAAASHDLRQPMHALSMFVAALEQETDADRRAELQAQIAHATQAMGDLLDSLLDISKLDAGAVKVQLTPVAIKPLLTRLHATYSGLALRRQVELVLRVKPCWALTDAVLLERMVGNLISNAIRYTPGDGSGKVLVALRSSGRDLRIEVRDNGPGIPPEAQEAVFEEFLQLNNPERDRSKGLGLGLAIVRRLGHLLGHEVALKSRLGSGSTFSVRVPQTQPPPLQHAPSAHWPPDQAPQAAHRFLQGRRVLVVDDDAMARDSLARVVDLWGADVIESSGDGDIVGSLEQSGWWPDLMLTDYRLRGETDGLQLLAQVQERSRLHACNVQGVVITGDTELLRLRQVGRSDLRVLFKPVRAPELRQVLDELLSPK